MPSFALVDIEKSVGDFSTYLKEFKIIAFANAFMLGSLGADWARALGDGVTLPLWGHYVRGRPLQFNVGPIVSTTITLTSTVVVMYILLSMTSVTMNKPVDYVRIVADSSATQPKTS